MSARGHETIDHTADMGVRGWGRTPAEAFEETASAMFELTADVHGLAPTRSAAISREATDLTGLLLEFLNALISEADIAGIVLVRAAVTRLERVGENWIIEALAGGCPVGDVRDRLLVEVKAATCCGASVTEGKTGVWSARCVVDL